VTDAPRQSQEDGEVARDNQPDNITNAAT
jgi:hypothetical protein